MLGSPWEGIVEEGFFTFETCEAGKLVNNSEGVGAGVIDEREGDWDMGVMGFLGGGCPS